MQNKYCLPIIVNNKEKVFEAIDKYHDYDYFELWLDYIADLDEDFLKKMISQYENRLLFLFRRQQLEPIKMPWEKRTKIISMLNNTKCLLDLDFSLQKPELEYLKDGSFNISKIVSYHNYEKTPDYRELSEILCEMEYYSPDIVKIATMCNNDNDALRLMNILQEIKKEKKQFMIIGMGEAGKITRVYGLLQGNVMNFAPKKLAYRSAPGQLIKEDLENISKMFNK